MKAIAILSAAAAAMLALNVSMASSQEVCSKGYQACMDSCGTKPSKSMQDSCFSNCEAKNNMCSDGVYGARSGAAVNVQTSTPSAAAKDAMAKKEPRGRDQKRMQKQEQAPAQEPQQDQAPEQEQAPAR